MHLIMIERLEQELHPLRAKLKQHPVYKSIYSIKDIQFFMENHVFAVWDFMSLLKQLQNLLSCNKIPWRPSGYPKSSRLINEIVWGEESDIDRNGVPMSHFEMYLQAMRSLGASSKKIDELIFDVNAGESMENILSKTNYPSHIKNFLDFTFHVVYSNKPHIIAAVFTFGREDLIPADYEIVDKRTTVPTEFPDFKFELRASQQEVFDRVDESCIINAWVSWGKTFTALAIASNLGQKTLVVVHTLALLKQWQTISLLF